MKYDTQLLEVSKVLPSAKNILVVLPVEFDIDLLSSSLALFLSLKQAGKEVNIITEGIVKVGHSTLFGVGQIQNKLPQVSTGDFVITLGGVVDAAGKIPSLEKMDYYPAGSDLNLVFKVLPGQKFEPTQITPRYAGGSFDLIFILGAQNLNVLGTIYTGNSQAFSNTHLINIDNSEGNTQFGTTNIIDSSASSLSEIVVQILPGLGLPLDGDIGTNILSGIFAATSNLQNEKVQADTYEAVALAVRSGGQKPISAVPGAATTDLPVETPAKSGFDLSKILGIPPAQGNENYIVPSVVNTSSNTPSPEEVPTGEGVATPENDWLTPKIFRGKGSSSIG